MAGGGSGGSSVIADRGRGAIVTQRKEFTGFTGGGGF